MIRSFDSQFTDGSACDTCCIIISTVWLVLSDCPSACGTWCCNPLTLQQPAGVCLVPDANSVRKDQKMSNSLVDWLLRVAGGITYQSRGYLTDYSCVPMVLAASVLQRVMVCSLVYACCGSGLAYYQQRGRVHVCLRCPCQPGCQGLEMGLCLKCLEQCRVSRGFSHTAAGKIPLDIRNKVVGLFPPICHCLLCLACVYNPFLVSTLTAGSSCQLYTLR